MSSDKLNYQTAIEVNESDTYPGWIHVSISPERYGYGEIRGLVDSHEAAANFIAENLPAVLRLAQVKAETDRQERLAEEASQS